MITNGRNFIGGRWIDTEDTIEDIDPGNGEVVGVLARGTAADVDTAVEAARRAALDWAAMAASARGAILRTAADDLEQQADEWARLMTREMGKPFPEARVECVRAAAILRFFAGEPHRSFGEQYASDHKASSRRGRGNHYAVELPGGHSDVEAGARSGLR
jgi:acyl-CoA reductase-like NAD-dependent aldehyde dehydrogenase